MSYALETFLEHPRKLPQACSARQRSHSTHKLQLLNFQKFSLWPLHEQKFGFGSPRFQRSKNLFSYNCVLNGTKIGAQKPSIWTDFVNLSKVSFLEKTKKLNFHRLTFRNRSKTLFEACSDVRTPFVKFPDEKIRWWNIDFRKVVPLRNWSHQGILEFMSGMRPRVGWARLWELLRDL